MSAMADQHIGLMDGAAALPRKNGELVFAAPWEGRVFGMAVALSDCRLYAWDDFRASLIAEAEARGDASSYYEQWLASFEKLLIARGVVSQMALDERTAALAAAEQDEHSHADAHDHDDDDDEDHGHDHDHEPTAHD